MSESAPKSSLRSPVMIALDVETAAESCGLIARLGMRPFIKSALRFARPRGAFPRIEARWPVAPKPVNAG